MTNDLKNFLEEEKKTFGKEVYEIDDWGKRYYPIDKIEKWIKDHDVIIINFVLDLLEKEVENLKYDNRYDLQHCKESNQDYFHGAGNSLNDISTIIKSLKQ